MRLMIFMSLTVFSFQAFSNDRACSYDGSIAYSKAKQDCAQSYHVESVAFGWCVGGINEAVQAYNENPETAIIVVGKRCENTFPMTIPSYCKEGAFAYLNYLGLVD